MPEVLIKNICLASTEGWLPFYFKTQNKAKSSISLKPKGHLILPVVHFDQQMGVPQPNCQLKRAFFLVFQFFPFFTSFKCEKEENWQKNTKPPHPTRSHYTSPPSAPPPHTDLDKHWGGDRPFCVTSFSDVTCKNILFLNCLIPGHTVSPPLPLGSFTICACRMVAWVLFTNRRTHIYMLPVSCST